MSLRMLFLIFCMSFFASGCSRYLGFDIPDSPAEAGLTCGCSLKGDGTGGDFLLMPQRLNTKIIRHTHLPWSWYDGALIKLWLVAPVVTVYSVGDAIWMGSLEPLKENPFGDLADRIAGGDGAARYVNGYRPRYVARVIEWTSWFNPFQAHFVGVENYCYTWELVQKPEPRAEAEPQEAPSPDSPPIAIE